MNDDFDELDRALFALPLETPPEGMRESIMSVTVRAQPAYALGRFDMFLIGSVLAVAVWLLLALIVNPGIGTAIDAQVVALMRAFADPSTLLWLAAGGAIVAWFSFGNVVAESVGFRRP